MIKITKIILKRKFQFQNGAIKRDVAGADHYNDFSFNSKMVRLRVIRVYCKCFFNLFQFQNGAIKSLQPKELKVHYRKFQFQNGAIKS